MSTWLDMEVANERKHLPGVSINIQRLLTELVFADECHDVNRKKEVRLTVQYRPSVETSLWWRLVWFDGEGDCFAEASRLELCLMRAAVLLRRENKRREQATENHPPKADL